LAEDSAEWLELGEQFEIESIERIVNDAVDGMDSSILQAPYHGRGEPPFPPELMLKIVLFEMLDGRSSPSQWFKDVRKNAALRWLGRGIHPSRTACYMFRDRLGNIIEILNKQLVNMICAEEGIVPTTGVMDGTTIRALASRHRLVNIETLLKRRESLQAAIEAAADSVAEVDQPNWMAATPGGRLEQANRYDQAKLILEGRIQENAKKPKDKRLKESHVKVSVSEPEAPLGRDKEKVFCALYTPQFMVEPSSFLILSYDVFDRATDTGTLPPMIDHTQEIVGGKLKKAIVDSSYVTVLDLQACQQRNIELIGPVQENSFTKRKKQAHTQSKQIARDQFHWLSTEQTYVCPQGHPLDYRGKQRKRRRGDQYVIEHRYHCSPRHCKGCPLASQCVRDPNKGRTIKRLEGQDLLDQQRKKMEDEEVKAEYKKRSGVIERTFGDVKGNREFRRFRSRGIARAKTQIGILVIAQNILTAHRLKKIRLKQAEDKT